MTKLTINDVIPYIQNIKQRGNQYVGTCPICEKEEHLYVTEKGGTLLMYCQKCQAPFGGILKALNVNSPPPPPITKAPKKNRTISEQYDHVYKNPDDSIAYYKTRTKYTDGSKNFAFHHMNGDKKLYTKPENCNCLYNLDLLEQALPETTLYIVEGEKCADIMNEHGFLTTTANGGANSVKLSDVDRAMLAKFSNKIIIPDTDEAGQKYIKLFDNVKVLNLSDIWQDIQPKQDIYDYITAGRDLNAVRDYVFAEPAETNDKLYNRPYVYTDDRTFKSKIIPPLMVKYMQEHEDYLFVKGADMAESDIYIYRDGSYRYITANEFKGLIKSQIPLLLHSRKTLDEVRGLIIADDKKYTSVEDLNADENIINFTNGILHLDTMQVTPHSPDILSTIQIPCEYIPNAQCPVDSHFERYIEYFTEGDIKKRKFLLQYMGMAISNVHGYRTKKALIMVGDGDTGKTQLRELCERLIGLKNSAIITLQQLEDNFGMAAIYNKRLAGHGDMKYMAAKELTNFKNLTGGDSVSIEFKYKEPFPYKFKGVMWFCCNELPKFGGDKGDWVYERIITLPCNHVVPEKMRDPELLDKMYSEREYVLKLCIDELKNFIANGYKYDLPDDVKSTLNNYKVENDSVLQFFKECCELKQGYEFASDELTKGKIYQMYKKWCDINNNGYRVINSEFNKTLKRYKIDETKKTNGGNEYYVKFKMTQSALDEYKYM